MSLPILLYINAGIYYVLEAFSNLLLHRWAASGKIFPRKLEMTTEIKEETNVRLFVHFAVKKNPGRKLKPLQGRKLDFYWAGGNVEHRERETFRIPSRRRRRRRESTCRRRLAAGEDICLSGARLRAAAVKQLKQNFANRQACLSGLECGWL